MTAKPKREKRELTERERRFVEAFAASGNQTHSARVAGYTGSDDALAQWGHRLVRNPKVASAIAELSRKRTRANIATREERLELLSEIARGEKLAPIGVANGKPVLGPPSHDARRKAAMDIARMNGELLERAPVEVNVNARSVHVVLMVPPSRLGPAPQSAPAIEASVDAAARHEDAPGRDGGAPDAH